LGQRLEWRDVLFQDNWFGAGFVDIQHEQWGVHKFFFSMEQKKSVLLSTRRLGRDGRKWAKERRRDWEPGKIEI
jgi:hypothetical protein